MNTIPFQKTLNTEQFSVVKNGDGPCLVLAGAGSGKTRTITYRVAYLLEQGVDPKEILLVTFTNKAAKEMVDRVQAITGAKQQLPWAGTFHRIGYKLLRRYAPLLGYQHNFSILDSADSRDVLKLCIKQEGLNKKAKRFPSTKVLQSIISFARNSQKTIEEVLDEKYPNWLDISDTITGIAKDYRDKKRAANAMDFDDLLANVLLLLKNSNKTKRKFAEQFRYILVDEYQDTNSLQAAIIDEFASVHKNILVVGDDAQSIYSFRAANIQNILDFEQRYPNAQRFTLNTNYRSTPEILEVANDVIANNLNQFEKELQSVQESFIKPAVHAFADNNEEAVFIAERILELRDEGVQLGDMAVLFRAAFHSQALEMELAKRDIPYEYRGGVRFFERAHIKDVLAYLRIVLNKDDSIAWSRVLTMQIGIGAVTAQKIIAQIQSAQADEKGHWNFPQMKLSARAAIGWNDFGQIWEAMQSARNHTPTELIVSIIESKYSQYLEAEYPDYRDRLADLEQLALFASNEPDLQKFLAEATLQEAFGAVAEQEQAEQDDEAPLILSTIHQAKGLEWQAVFVLHMAQGQFPNERALSEREGIEEERRLFYVAVTRAKKQLYMSYPLTSLRSTMLGGPSVFLEEISRNLVDQYQLRGETVFFDEELYSGPSFTDPSDEVDDVVYVSEEDQWEDKKRPKSFLLDF